MTRFACALVLLLGLALPAEAATFFASPAGAGSACSQATPCSLATLITTLQPGDVGTVTPGTYAGLVQINNKNGTASQPITLRAQNFAVQCADAANDPDGCVVNTASRSILSDGMRFSSANADHWIIEGFETRDELNCAGSSIGSGPDHITIRYMHLNADASGDEGMFLQYCADVVFTHSYITRRTSPNGRYGIDVFFNNQNITVRNIFCTGNFNHCISIKRNIVNATIERFVCFGVASECIHVGQEPDDTASIAGGGTSCPGSTLGDGTTGTLWDMTSRNITIRRVYAVPGNEGATHYVLRVGLRVGNVEGLDAQDIFVANEDSSAHPFWHGRGTANANRGTCGVEPGNNLIRGMILVAPDSGPCAFIAGVGDTPDTLTIENYICHNSGAQAIDFDPLTGDNLAGYSNLQHPVTIVRNSIFNDCLAAFSGQVVGRLTQSHNNLFNCGASIGGTGAQTVDPQFVGPESVPDGTINLTTGQALWDWEVRYQPIIDRFRTQRASFVDAGVGSDSPCTGVACNIGTNEFFFAVPLGIWQSCAVYGNNEQVFGSFTNPWISGRGLVIDVDCEAQRFVIGRCDDPLDEATCDTDVYIYKAAQLRKQRDNEPVTLSTGTAASAADTSGTCWRTRATLDFTESLEELTGIWVRYEVDPDGGTHTCSAVSPPTFAWQGVE